MGQNEVRVVLLGRLDGLVAEELLNSADVRALSSSTAKVSLKRCGWA